MLEKGRLMIPGRTCHPSLASTLNPFAEPQKSLGLAGYRPRAELYKIASPITNVESPRDRTFESHHIR